MLHLLLSYYVGGCHKKLAIPVDFNKQVIPYTPYLQTEPSDVVQIKISRSPQDLTAPSEYPESISSPNLAIPWALPAG
jgi:hypothetical protein